MLEYYVSEDTKDRKIEYFLGSDFELKEAFPERWGDLKNEIEKQHFDLGWTADKKNVVIKETDRIKDSYSLTYHNNNFLHLNNVPSDLKAFYEEVLEKEKDKFQKKMDGDELFINDRPFEYVGDNLYRSSGFSHYDDDESDEPRMYIHCYFSAIMTVNSIEEIHGGKIGNVGMELIKSEIQDHDELVVIEAGAGRQQLDSHTWYKVYDLDNYIHNFEHDDIANIPKEFLGMVKAAINENLLRKTKHQELKRKNKKRL